MAEIDIEVTGLGPALELLAGIPGAVQRGLVRASKRIADEGQAFWRALVTVRTGTMRMNLHVVTQVTERAVVIGYIVGVNGFYYQFQRQRRNWNAALVRFLSKRAPEIVREEVNRQVSRLEA